MKELLIIRSVSFQQIDLNLPEIKKKFPDYKISILTHEHGIELAKKYKDICHIYVYGYSGAFKKKNRVKALMNKKFDAVIIPVTNITGVGFLNVLKYGFTIKSKEYYMCNVISDIKIITRNKITGEYIKGAVNSIISGIMIIPLLVLGLPYLLIQIKRIEKKK